MKEANPEGRYIPKNHSLSSPDGAEPDSNPTAAALCQTDVTDLNCSDHSTISKEMVSWRAFGVHPSDTDSGSDSTIHYVVAAILQPTTIATRKK